MATDSSSFILVIFIDEMEIMEISQKNPALPLSIFFDTVNVDKARISEFEFRRKVRARDT